MPMEESSSTPISIDGGVMEGVSLHIHGIYCHKSQLTLVRAEDVDLASGPSV